MAATKRGRRALHALSAGAAALPGLAGNGFAEAPAERVRAEYGWSNYSEDSVDSDSLISGSEGDRYEIDMHQFSASVPLGDRFDAALDVSYETMTGASPWFILPAADGTPVQVMSGATIEEERTDLLLSGSYYLDRGKLSAGSGISVEKDYTALNGNVAGEWHLNDKLTTLSGGLGFSFDDIEPTDSNLFLLRPEHGEKNSQSLFFGVAQVIDRFSVIQTSLAFQRSKGYLDDPYKQVFVAGSVLADSRPDARLQGAWLTRYRRHFAPVEGTLHADYRFAVDDWSMTAHSFELAWYQSFFDFVRVVPSFRYYTQSQTNFYAPYYLVPRSDGHHSNDYRLSPYGAISWKVKAETDFHTPWIRPIDWKANLTWERYRSDTDLAPVDVSIENPGLVSFNLLTFGLKALF